MAVLKVLITACLLVVARSSDETFANSNSEEEVLPMQDVTVEAITSTLTPQLMCDVCICPELEDTERSEIMCKDKGLTAVPQWDGRILNDAIADLRLNLDVNRLHTLPVFPRVRRLIVVSLCENSIQKIEPFTFADLPALQLLSLAKNQIKRLHQNAFAGHNNTDLHLRELDLSGNFLRTLDSDLFDHLPELDTLHLHHNSFSNIDTATATALNSLHHLTTLSLAWVNLRTLPDGLSNPVTTLQKLDLAGNNFTKIPPVLHLASSLRNLNLNSNPFSVFTDGDFEGLGQLRELNISVMPDLTAIHEGTFASLTELHTLDCRHNLKLSYISPKAFTKEDETLQHVLKVYLNHNNLTTLDKKLLNWIGIEELDLQGNPFICDCHIKWMRTQVVFNKHPELTEYLNCSRLNSTIPKRIMDVEESVFQTCLPLARPPPNPEANSMDDTIPTSRNTVGISLILGGVLGIGIVATLVIVGYIVRRRRKLAFGPKPRVRYVKAQSTDADGLDDVP